MKEYLLLLKPHLLSAALRGADGDERLHIRPFGDGHDLAQHAGRNTPVGPDDQHLFAGRRGCPVTAELVQNIVPEDLLSALTKNDEDKTKSIIMDTDDADGMIIKDVPISFSPFNRQYRYRFVKKL